MLHLKEGSLLDRFRACVKGWQRVCHDPFTLCTLVCLGFLSLHMPVGDRGTEVRYGPGTMQMTRLTRDLYLKLGPRTVFSLITFSRLVFRVCLQR